MKRWFLAGFAAALLSAQQSRPVAPDPVLAHISADSLRGNVSFLASDALEGRATPSRGLDIAAEFIASRFRAAGLEPIGSHQSYFQEAKFLEVRPKPDDLKVTLVSEGSELTLDKTAASVRAVAALDLSDATVLDLPADGNSLDVAGKIVAGAAGVYGTEAGLLRLQARKPALVLLVSKRRGRPAGTYLEEAGSGNAPVVRIGNEDAYNAVTSGKDLKLSVHSSAPDTREFVARNVGGVLRGSDPALKSEFLLVTAHYDHVGTRTGSGDTIFNGANDNGSGTASVVEIASALAAASAHPKRSIIFMTLFGEEEGLLGAYYYAKHPLFPLAKTVAAINLEQMGRTDDEGGTRVRSFSFTGPTYSDVPERMTEAAKAVDVSVYSRPDADSFFARSDNYAFALKGVIAHTVVVAYEYPDYHAVGDEWQKLDYANMAAVDRGVAAGIIKLADDPTPPKWHESKNTEPYRPPTK